MSSFYYKSSSPPPSNISLIRYLKLGINKLFCFLLFFSLLYIRILSPRKHVFDTHYLSNVNVLRRLAIATSIYISLVKIYNIEFLRTGSNSSLFILHLLSFYSSVRVSLLNFRFFSRAVYLPPPLTICASFPGFPSDSARSSTEKENLLRVRRSTKVFSRTLTSGQFLPRASFVSFHSFFLLSNVLLFRDTRILLPSMSLSSSKNSKQTSPSAPRKLGAVESSNMNASVCTVRRQSPLTPHNTEIIRKIRQNCTRSEEAKRIFFLKFSGEHRS